MKNWAAISKEPANAGSVAHLFADFERASGKIVDCRICVLSAACAMTATITTTNGEYKLEWGGNTEWPHPIHALIAVMRAYSANTEVPGGTSGPAPGSELN